MKNEDRIVELLSESLKRQDQMVDEMHRMRGGIQEMRGDIKEMRDDINKVAVGVSTLTDIVKVWMDKTKEIDILKDQVQRINRHIGLK